MSKKPKKPKVRMAEGSWSLLPPRPDVCQECATKHEPGAPHNKDSLYYQMRFHAEHGRYPAWSDAIAHCTPDVQASLKEYLEGMGVWSAPIKGMPKEERVARKIAGMPTHSDKPDGGPMNVVVMKRVDSK